jgi:hypothetical protein
MLLSLMNSIFRNRVRRGAEISTHGDLATLPQAHAITAQRYLCVLDKLSSSPMKLTWVIDEE